MSAHQLHRMLGHHLSRGVVHGSPSALRDGDERGSVQKLSGTVEVDETYVGGKRRAGGRNTQRQAVDRPSAAAGHVKTPVVALVERKGRALAFPVERVDGTTLQEAIRRRASI